MSDALLTIVVPTYNRAAYLQRLLQTLRTELDGLHDEVQVLVSDNASTDHTSSLLHSLKTQWPALIVQRNQSNLGADGNFCECMDRVETRYCWFIGDDDLPKVGVVRQIVTLLHKTSPTLVYMQSEWFASITGPGQGESVGALRADAMDALAFARRVHVWLTFISGVILDRSLLMQRLGKHTIRRFTGTSLVQLGWVLPLLQSDGHFIFINDRCMLATKDNTGGYPLLSVFGVGFARIANETFGRGSRMADILIGRSIVHYLPGLTWGARQAPSGRHSDEDPWPGMRAELGGWPMYWLLLVPLGQFPGWLAQPVYQAWRVFHRLSRELQKLREHVQLRRRSAR